jgi:Fur family transcriptional regulator, ferric uptake regulator
MRMILILTARYGIRVAEARQADYQSLLAERGLRPTRQRVAVLGALASRDDATAQQIHALLADDGVRVGLATVYRTLGWLAEHGVVDTLMHHRGEACYRLCGDGHHHHLVCSGCHRVVELGECELDPWLADLAAEHDFALEAHTVEVTGRCPACQA